MKAILTSLLAVCLVGSAARAQGTAFTYQGSLSDGGAPAQGLHDMRFRLYDGPVGGTQIGVTLCADDLVVTNGLLAATLDFGQQFATEAPRYLEAEVRVDSGLSCGDTTGYVVLTPRQVVGNAPRAIAAKVAQGLVATDGSTVNAVSVAPDGRVGVGTATPTAPLHVYGNQAALRLQDDGDAASSLLIEDRIPGEARINKVCTAGYSALQLSPMPTDGVSQSIVQFFRDTNTTGSKSVNFLRGNGGSTSSAFIGVDGQNSAFQLQGGNLGIGTASPSRPLHMSTPEPVVILQDVDSSTSQVGYVSFRNSSSTETAWVGYGSPGSPHFTMINARSGGDVVLSAASNRIRLGTSGQYYAPGGEENLRIIRGRIFANGTVADGSGFTVSRTGTGKYVVTFTTAFTDTPTATAMVETGTNDPTKFVQRGPVQSNSSYFFEVIQRSDGSYADGTFSFIVIGPR